MTSNSLLKQIGIASVFLMAFSSNQSQAGFFDDIVEKAKRTTQDTYQKAVDAATGNPDEPEQQATKSAPAPQVSSSSQQSGVTFDKNLVRKTQQRLNALGINVGGADGIYGKGTANGIKQFQQQQGLAVDGRPSEQLLAKLDSTLAATSTKKQTFSTQSKISLPNDSGKYIELKDIPIDPRPATPASLSLARLRYDQSWLNEKQQLVLTEAVIYCQQNMIKAIGHMRGCIGERANLDSIGRFETRVVPVFEPSEIDGRNRKFVAQANKDRVKPVLVELANHLPPKFGNTLTWRGTYDFAKGVLRISIRNMEKAENYHMNRIPKAVRHLDVYKTPDRNFEGVRGEYYPMKAYIPEQLAGGVIALAFDRNLAAGEYAIPANRAEVLFKGQSGSSVSGIAVVEFSVNNTAGSAALATLDQVKILSLGESKLDLSKVEPVVTIPASSFPKMATPKAPVKTAPVSKPKTPPIETKQIVVEKVAVDPYARAEAGSAFGPDVIGIRLGMTLEQAAELIGQKKEIQKVISGNPPRPFTGAKIYVLKPGDEFIGLFTLKTSSGERIASIERTLYFDPDKSPSQTAIASSVEKKYGTPSSVSEVKGNFRRSWYSDAQGNPIKSDGVATRACEYALSRSAPDVWLENGKYYQWEMPWRERTYMGVRSGPAIGSHKALQTNAVNYCGPALQSRYEDGAGILSGAMLYVHLYDPAWAVADYKKIEKSDKAQGVKGLDL